MPKGSNTLVASLLKNSDLVLAISVISILAMMVIPLPAWLLSLLLALNLTFSLVILMSSIYTREPLQFSVFPSLLLLVTLFRLSLNVSSTRLILLDGYAGEVIQKFGEFVVGGNAVVGFIVFLILVIIQFIVITRGAERVAEVAARFTLDAMPGKQMSIDADLNAGLINDQEARRRRREIEREADFYGAMDGASKFVKGDAIASLVVTVINILGGFIIGMAQQGLAWNDALQRYTLLTVGDGLVTQIPALLISTATGIIVTRAASEDNLARDVAGQVLAQPRALTIAAGALAVLGVMPGLPNLVFLSLAACFGFLAYVTRQSDDPQGAREADEAVQAEAADDGRSPESVTQLLAVDPMEIELGYGLLVLADPSRGGDLMDRVGLIRRQVALELGFVLPLVRVRDNMQLAPNQYTVKLRGVEIARGEILPERLLALDPGTVQGEIAGIKTTDPAFGLPARWILTTDRDRAETMGYTVVEPSAVLATHMTQLVKTYAYQLLGRQEVKALLDSVREGTPVVVDELVPGLLTTGEVQKVLQNLLREGVAIRDMVTILETLADWASTTKDPDRLTEFARQALARQISQELPLQDGRLAVIALSPEMEEQIQRAVESGDRGGMLPLNPETIHRALASLEQEARQFLGRGQEPVIVCAPLVRLYFKRLTERVLPNLKIISYNELTSDIQVEVMGTVKV